MSAASYNANNQLTNWNGAAISYDANGNMTSNGGRSFVWNARNQLASLNGYSVQYDAFGRRTMNAAGTGFLYDGLNAVQELSGSTVTANILTGGVDENFLRSDAGGSWNFLSDALGSTLGLTDPTGTVQTQYTYDPFGNTSAAGISTSNPAQYTGRENDGTELYYYRARYYDPTIGRFISEDPIGFAAGPNFYSYVLNNPLRFTDPFGQDVWLEGPSGHEPTGHLSINVGDPNGNYDSYSFGVNGDPHLGGEVYKDTSLGGEILPDHYLHTTANEDARVKAMLDAQVGDKAPYRPWRTCRNFSQNQFNKIKVISLI